MRKASSKGFWNDSLKWEGNCGDPSLIIRHGGWGWLKFPHLCLKNNPWGIHKLFPLWRSFSQIKRLWNISLLCIRWVQIKNEEQPCRKEEPMTIFFLLLLRYQFNFTFFFPARAETVLIWKTKFWLYHLNCFCITSAAFNPIKMEIVSIHCARAFNTCLNKQLDWKK